MRLILASSSPRRAEILRDAGFAFEVAPADIDETPRPSERAHALVRRLAEAKARAVAARAGDDAIVLGADTEVVVDGDVFGKPADAADARRMLEKLSGRAHEVITGVALLRTRDGALLEAIESTQVTFATITPQEIEAYVASGEPLGKAGAYAVQGLGGRFVTRIEGCYFNVVGLPLARVYALLRDLECGGWTPLSR
ncbi:MAG TPA: Maf family protein [Candidatus Acidoferrales bacterium]